ncbi:MAG: SUMF1/EgtB/PvdO family nonheme iron enzyme [Haliscomenobacter sp.]|nr:SUMF1/EgtB/PvdO family nonheme iron enzyme [Haliscomenobacter sp.]
MPSQKDKGIVTERVGEPAAGPKGKNYLLVIGIDEYAHCPPLYNCVKDAQDLIELLSSEYSFSIDNDEFPPLFNQQATKENITDAFRRLAMNVTPEDNVLIYFSGHGEYDNVFQQGYWVPVEAEEEKITGYLPNSDVRVFLNAIKSRHTFLMADSCFSGALFMDKSAGKIISRRSERDPSRWGLTSGRNEIVSDGEPGKNSPFAESLLYWLRNNTGHLGVDQLCAHVKEHVEANSNQTPIGEPLKVEGHKNGLFVFHRLPKETNDWERALSLNTPEAYAQFLEMHPKSPHAEEAWWQRALLLNSAEAYDDYLDRYPGGRFARQALEALDHTEEDEFWHTVQRKDTRAAYRSYLDKYSIGRYRTVALERIAILRQHTALVEPFMKPQPETAPRANQPQQETPARMVFVKGGTFEMGCTKEQGDDCFDKEKPAHNVTVKDFHIGRTAVTVADFKAFIEDSRYKTDAEKQGLSRIWTGSEYKDGKGVNWRCDVSGKVRPESESDHPVIHVSWNDAVAYCQWLAQKIGQRYRLPTEAEWEYAARGGQESKGYKYAGSHNLGEVAWFDGNSGGKTHPVGTKKPNELGLYDMSGNVWEWCEDDWHGNYHGAPTDGSAWVDSPRASRRVDRGGGWDYTALHCRAVLRNDDTPSGCYGDLGFRLAL